jgi:2,4-dienoyl-CoA reductase-like NADH-dependent reductase (Old Yellow Enzyme family)
MNSTPFPHLSSGLRLGALQLGHRMVVIGRPRSVESDVCASAPRSLIDYYGTLASLGGLVICSIAPVRDAQHDPMLGIRSAAEVNGWRSVTAAIHANGGIAVARIGNALSTGEAVLNVDQLDDALDAYRTAAENVSDAGFDGIELVGMHSSLPERLSGAATDAASEPGSRLEEPSSTPFLDDALRAIFGVWPSNRVGISLSLPRSAHQFDGALCALRSLTGFELAYVHLTANRRKPRLNLSLVVTQSRPIRRAGLIVSGPWTAEDAEASIEAGETDAVGSRPPMFSNIAAAAIKSAVLPNRS